MPVASSSLSYPARSSSAQGLTYARPSISSSAAAGVGGNGSSGRHTQPRAIPSSSSSSSRQPHPPLVSASSSSLSSSTPAFLSAAAHAQLLNRSSLDALTAAASGGRPDLAHSSDSSNPHRTKPLLVFARPGANCNSTSNDEPDSPASTPTAAAAAAAASSSSAAADGRDGSSSSSSAAGPLLLYVNSKQYSRILCRREARAALAGRLVSSISKDKPFLHVSRHAHAMRRPRHPSGRFYTKVEIAALKAVGQWPGSAQNAAQGDEDGEDEGVDDGAPESPAVADPAVASSSGGGGTSSSSGKAAGAKGARAGGSGKRQPAAATSLGSSSAAAAARAPSLLPAMIPISSTSGSSGLGFTFSNQQGTSSYTLPAPGLGPVSGYHRNPHFPSGSSSGTRAGGNEEEGDGQYEEGS